MMRPLFYAHYSLFYLLEHHQFNPPKHLHNLMQGCMSYEVLRLQRFQVHCFKNIPSEFHHCDACAAKLHMLVMVSGHTRNRAEILTNKLTKNAGACSVKNSHL